MRIHVTIAKLLALALVTSGVLVSCLLASATAQEDPANMSCNALWNARNSIYAQNGYCFKTARASSLRPRLLPALRKIERMGTNPREPTSNMGKPEGVLTVRRHYRAWYLG
jgi:hypothetical protein